MNSDIVIVLIWVVSWWSMIDQVVCGLRGERNDI